jgi:hypothetical protein
MPVSAVEVFSKQIERGKADGVARLHLGRTLALSSALSITLFSIHGMAQTQPAPSVANQETVPATLGKEPLAIVPIEATNANQARVSGALQITNGTAFITSNGTVTSGASTTSVMLPRRGVLRVCAATAVSLSADSSVAPTEPRGLMIAMDHGAVEASFAAGKNSDILMTPDFRIVIGGPGAVEVKVRLGEHGDTCVDNPGADAPYVLVSSVFDGGAYRVKPGQRVMFQHGSLREVVDQEKEPCGCPPPHKADSNEFPMDESAGLSLKKPTATLPPPVVPPNTSSKVNAPLVYSASAHADTNPAPPAAQTETAQAAPATETAPAAVSAPPAAKQKKPGFFRRAGRFFKKIFGAD